MEYVILAAVVVGGAVAISAYVTSRRRVWVIHIRAGVPFLTRGKIAQTVVAELADVLQRHGVRRGALLTAVVEVYKAGARQALRNVWSMHAR